MPPHSLTNFQIHKFYQNGPRFNSVYSTDDFQKLKDGAYIITLDEYCVFRTHWVAWYVQNKDVTYFDSFGVERIPREIKTFISNKNVKTNIFRIQTYDSIVRTLLYWIYWFYACRKDFNVLYKSFSTK